MSLHSIRRVPPTSSDTVPPVVQHVLCSWIGSRTNFRSRDNLRLPMKSQVLKPCRLKQPELYFTIMTLRGIPQLYRFSCAFDNNPPCSCVFIFSTTEHIQNEHLPLSYVYVIKSWCTDAFHYGCVSIVFHKRVVKQPQTYQGDKVVSEVQGITGTS